MARPRSVTSPASAILSLQVHPRSASDRISGVIDGVIRLRVSTPPVDGKANSRCIALLAKHFQVAPSTIQIIRGAHARLKVVRIQGMTQEDASIRLQEIQASSERS